ncbi:hypothetical protein Tco_0183705 [Tanacetum coccineum]
MVVFVEMVTQGEGRGAERMVVAVGWRWWLGGSALALASCGVGGRRGEEGMEMDFVFVKSVSFVVWRGGSEGGGGGVELVTRMAAGVWGSDDGDGHHEGWF